MDMKVTPRASARLFAAYLALVPCAWAIGARVSAPVLLLVGVLHATAALVVLRRAWGRSESRLSLLAPYALWSACWLELGWLIRLSGRAMNDGAVAGLDGTLFGGHPHLLLPTWMPGAAGAMETAYLSYYGLVLGPAVYFAWRGDRTDAWRYAFPVMATYLVCFLAYLAYPVLGPRAFAESSRSIAAPESAGLAALLRALGDSPGTAFPSSHCAGSWAAAFALWSIRSSRIGIACAIWAALVTISTVHTGNHYAIDAAAGVTVAVALHLFRAGHRSVRPALRREVLS